MQFYNKVCCNGSCLMHLLHLTSIWSRATIVYQRTQSLQGDFLKLTGTEDGLDSISQTFHMNTSSNSRVSQVYVNHFLEYFCQGTRLTDVSAHNPQITHKSEQTHFAAVLMMTMLGHNGIREACRSTGCQETDGPETRRIRRTSVPARSLMRFYLPWTLFCSDYTMCLDCLWASEPFCSVKQETISGGQERGVTLTSLPRLNSLNHDPGFSFTQEVSLA